MSDEPDMPAVSVLMTSATSGDGRGCSGGDDPAGTVGLIGPVALVRVLGISGANFAPRGVRRPI